MSSFDEFAASNGKSRWAENFSSGAGSNNGDEAALTGLFQQAFGPAQHTSQEIPFEESFPLDEFEAGVMTSCLLSAADSVPVPANFEDQVMSRINADKVPVQEVPRSFRSPMLRHTSRELYLRYRRVVQVVFPLAAAASIVIAMYVRDNGINLGSVFTWPPFSTQTVEPANNSNVQMPELQMQQPAPEQPAVQAGQGTQSADAKKAASSKKKMKTKKDRDRGFQPITGE